MLNKIWASFIVMAILAGTVQTVFTDKKANVFSSMVVGKTKDTCATKLVSFTSVEPRIQSILQEDSVYKKYDKRLILRTDGKVLRYCEQGADGVLETCKNAVNLCLGLIGIMALFMGFLAIAEKAGGIRLLSRLIAPFFTRLFPEVPKGHESMGHMVMNFSANLLGLDNVATPFGIKAMQSLQSINPDKEKASNSQIMFMCLHASGLTLIPVSIIALRVGKSVNPTDIFIPCMIATFMATLAALLLVSMRQKVSILQPVVLLWLIGVSLVMASLVYYASSLSKDGLDSFSGLLSNGLILFIFLVIVLGAWYKKVAIFDEFVEGAKQGFDVAIKIIPYLVGMLVAISMLRTSGCFDFVLEGIRYVFASLGTDTQFVEALPTALIKPLSGSGARGMMVDTMNVYGADSFAGRLSAVFQGSSDTTFYVIAVYFGSISVRNTRYTLPTMLLADLVGIITAITVCYLWFG
jgi:spore maturation protein SpmA/spore maturation protein SpmB